MTKKLPTIRITKDGPLINGKAIPGMEGYTFRPSADEDDDSFVFAITVRAKLANVEQDEEAA